jgi:hypothetical protein
LHNGVRYTGHKSYLIQYAVVLHNGVRYTDHKSYWSDLHTTVCCSLAQLCQVYRPQVLLDTVCCSLAQWCQVYRPQVLLVRSANSCILQYAVALRNGVGYTDHKSYLSDLLTAAYYSML